MDQAMVGLLVVLGLGVAIAMLFQRLGVSALVAYLATGALAGPAALGLVDVEHITPLAEVGAALLLFSIGLELDLGRMRAQARAIAIAAPLQIGLTTLVGGACAMAVGLAWAPAIALGACLTMTSTVLVLRALDEHRLKGRDESTLTLGVTLAQDVMIGPLLILFSLLIPVQRSGSPLGMVVAVAALGVGTVLLRRMLATRLLARIRAAQLPELETAFCCTLALGAAAATHHAGLGAALGAFAAGLALGGAERHAVEGGMRPVLGLTAVFFFVSMGLLFDPVFVYDHLGTVLALLVAATALKALIAGFALRLTGMGIRHALGYGLVLANIGEFAFVLAAGAFGASDDPAVEHLYRLVVATTCLSLALTPILVRIGRPLLPGDPLARISAAGDTIVVAGLGPMGNLVVDTLRRRGHPLLLVDRNPQLLATWKDTPGVTLIQARIEQIEEWLPRLGHQPSLVVLTFPIADASALVARRLRELIPDLPVLARSPFIAQVESLRESGVDWVLCDEHETVRALIPVLEDALAKAGERRDRHRQTINTNHHLDSQSERP